MKNIIFFGPPGAGKGTQAKVISEYLELPHLSTGDILRSKIKDKDALALELKDIMSSGKLVSDQLLNSIVSEKLINDCKNGFILDGYPRTLVQSVFLNNFLDKSNIKIDYIFNIEIEFNILEMRILKRSQEEKRDDDNLNVLKTRYEKYLETTKIVSNSYKSQMSQIFYNIDGNEQISEITNKIKKIVKNSWYWANI